jgi:flagellar basal-body rod modification protein FlgD
MMFDGLSGATSAAAGTQAAGSQAKLNEDLNSFLNLLITQLKHQDPLEPMDATEFTSQLVQFASVEQQIYQNANLEQLLNLQQTSQVASMVDYLGTTIEATGQQINLENGQAEFTYTMGSGASAGTIIIRNEAGLSVFSADANAEFGKHNFTWDGNSNGGEPMPDGTYTINVTATDRGGEILDVTQTVFGRVTGAGVDNGAVTMYMGDVAITMADVLSVKETPQASQ